MHIIVVLSFFSICITLLRFFRLILRKKVEVRIIIRLQNCTLFYLFSFRHININSCGKTGIEYYSREIIYRLQFNHRRKTDLNYLIMFD